MAELGKRRFQNLPLARAIIERMHNGYALRTSNAFVLGLEVGVDRFPVFGSRGLGTWVLIAVVAILILDREWRGLRDELAGGMSDSGHPAGGIFRALEHCYGYVLCPAGPSSAAAVYTTQNFTMTSVSSHH